MLRIVLALFCFLCVNPRPLFAGVKFSNTQSGITFPKDESKLILEAPILNVTGKISFKDDDPSHLEGVGPLDVITFDNGITGTIGQEYTFSGAIEPLQGDKFTLRDNEVMDVTNKEITHVVRVMHGQVSEVKGSPIFRHPLEIGIGGTLNLGMTGIMHQPIAAEGTNVVNLTQSLRMSLGIPVNTGTIDVLNLGGFELFLNNSLSDITSYEGAGTVHFMRGHYQINQAFNFNGTVDVNGQESTLEFDTGGSMNFGPGLHDLTDIDLKNISTTQPIFVDPAGTVFLSDAVIRLDSDVTLSGQGEIVVLGENCKIVANGYKFQVDEGTKLTVDGVTLLYEPLSPFDDNPIEAVDLGSGPGIIDLLNGGRIESVHHGLSIQDHLNVTDALLVAKSNFYLTETSKLTFVNENVLVNKPITYDSDGYFINFPPRFTGDQLLIVEGNVALTLQNVSIKDFNAQTVSLVDANSTIEFGQDSTVSISSDQDITAAFPWVFSGDSLIDGGGKTINLKAASTIQVKNGATLTINNAHIKTEDIGAFASLDDTSNICFQDCIITIDKSGLDLATGNYLAKGLVQVFGADKTDVTGSTTLSFSSKGTMTVSSHSELTLNRGVVFEYKADPTDDGINTSATKRHFKLIDPSAKMHLNGCSLVSTQTGFALDFGTVFVSDVVKFTIDTTAAAEAEFGTDLLVEVLAGGCLDVDGPLRYISTTFTP